MPRRAISFITLTLSLLVAVPAKAQFLQGYGVRAGGNVLDITGYIIEFEQSLGFQIAAFAEFLTTPAFSFQVELEYARRRYGIEQVETSGSGEVLGIVRAVTTLNYLSIPVLARLRYPGKPRVIPYALVGPRLDFLVERKPGVWEFSQGSFIDDTSEVFTDVGVSGIVGLGFAFEHVIGQQLRFEGRYSFGLTDLIPELDAWTVRNNSLELSVVMVLWGSKPTRN